MAKKKDVPNIDIDEPIDVAEIQEEARANFSLADRLKGTSHRKGKITLFLDLPAVDAYDELKQKLNNIEPLVLRAQKRADDADPKTEEGQSLRRQADELVATFTKTEDLAEEAKVEMLKGALVVHLQGYPNAAIEGIRREMFKKFRDKSTGKIPDEKIENAQQWLDTAMLGHCVVKIIDSSGAAADMPTDRHALGAMLRQMLPPSQFQRLYDGYLRITLTDSIGKAATDEPGF